MLQRKQTLYLLAATILTVVLLFANVYTLDVQSVDALGVSSIESYKLGVWGVKLDGGGMFSTIYFGLLVSLTAALSFVTIFLYRKRWLQVRLCFAMMIMQVGILCFGAYYIYQMVITVPQATAVAYSYSTIVSFPVLSIIALVLAYRGVARDIALLASANRIR